MVATGQAGEPGQWNGTGDRKLQRTMEVDEDASTQDEEWHHVAGGIATPALELYRQLLARGYEDMGTA